MEISKTFCIRPWQHLSIDTTGKCKSCAFMCESHYISDKFGNPFNIYKDNIEKILQSEHLVAIKNSLLNGYWPKECNKCEAAELEPNSFNPRKHYNEIYTSTNIIKEGNHTSNQLLLAQPPALELEINAGNHCNFQCITCWSFASSSLLDQRKKAISEEPDRLPHFLKEQWRSEITLAQSQYLSWSNESEYLRNIESMLSNISHITFSGGEPALIESNWKIIENLDRLLKHDVAISIITNLTPLDPERIALLRKFKKVTIFASIDGIGSVNEYIRFPSNWLATKSNFETYLSGPFEVFLITTVQALNILNIPDVLTWLSDYQNGGDTQINLSFLPEANHLSIHSLPTEIIELALIKFQKICANPKISTLHKGIAEKIKSKLLQIAPSTTENRKKLWQTIEYYDKQRTLTCQTAMPELHFALFKEFELPNWRENLSRVQNYAKTNMPGICPLPWNHLSADTIGRLRVCCDSSMGEIEYQSSIDQNISSVQDVTSYLNSEHFIKIRTQMLKGEKPAVCKRCYEYESSGATSPRQDWLEHYYNSMPALLSNTSASGEVNQAQIQYLDLALGNVCNLQCRMCGPTTSIAMLEEAVALGLLRDSGVAESKKASDTYSVKTVDLLKPIFSTLEEFFITGGEPFIERKAHKQLLQAIVNSGFAGKIKLRYNSNITKIDSELFLLWQNFKHVQINCSIDAVGPLLSYIRNNSDWEKIKSNLYELDHYAAGASNVSLQIHCTFQAYNLLNIAKLLHFFASEPFQSIEKMPYFIQVFEPFALSAIHLPLNLRQKANLDIHATLKKYNLLENRMTPRLLGLLNWVTQENETSNLDSFLTYTKKMDGYRGQNFLDFLPELKTYC